MMKRLQLYNLPGTALPALRAGFFVAAMAAAATTSVAGPKPQTGLEQIFYDIGVIGYCGLSNEEVTRGFNRQLKKLVDRDNLDAVQIRDARNDALSMVEWEWDNRGLGGFRGWCKNEGEAAVERFTD